MPNKLKKKTLSLAVKQAIVTGMIASIGIVPTTMAQTDDGAKELDKVQITGTRIRRADVEGATPVFSIDREDIDLSGVQTIPDLLRTTTFNSFGSFRDRSGTSFGQIALINLRALGADRTAVLINGRRVPGSPFTGSAAVDLSTIPITAVERIDILTDSASAVYGADAIGGVVNIILRDNYEGIQAEAGFSRPTREGSDEDFGHFITGGDYDKGNFVFSAQYFNRDPVFDGDRDYSGVQVLQEGGAFGTDTRGISVGGNTGFDTDFTESFVVGDCDTDVYAGVFTGAFGLPGEGCGFGYADISQQTGLVKTFNTFLNANYELSGNHSLFFQNTYTRRDSRGRYAPAVGFFRVSADSPFNTRGEEFDLFHRFVAHGPRDDNSETIQVDNVIGLEGLIGNDVGYEAYVRHFRYDADQFGNTYILASQIEEEVANGTYNFANPFSTDPDHLAAVQRSSATINRDIQTVFRSAGVNFDGLAFELPAGAVGWSAGAEYADEEYQDIYDSFREAGNILGSAGNSADGQRDRVAVFGEVAVPLLDSLELNVAARWDDFSDFGDEFSPQVSLRYQPLRTLLLRASWGEGFKAPNLTDLNQARSQSFNNVTDFVQCRAQGIADEDCPTFQVENFTGGNPNLTAETSESFNLGVVWEPIENLTMGFDWYNIEIDDAVQQIGVQTLINLEAAGSPLPSGTAINRAASVGGVPGRILTIERGFANVATFEVEGIDFNVQYTHAFDELGLLSLQLQGSHLMTYDFTSNPDAQAVDQLDLEGAPENRANLQARWSIGDHTLNFNSRWIDSTLSSAGTDRPDLRYPSFVTHDITYAYQTPWDGTISLGVRNIADRDPSIDPVAGYTAGVVLPLYSVDGRVPFLRYTHDFK